MLRKKQGKFLLHYAKKSVSANNDTEYGCNHKSSIKKKKKKGNSKQCQTTKPTHSPKQSHAESNIELH